MKSTTPFPNDAISYAEEAQRDSFINRHNINYMYALPGELMLAEPVMDNGHIASLTLLVGYQRGRSWVANEVEVRVYDCQNDVFILSDSQHLKVGSSGNLQTLKLPEALAVSPGQYIGLRYPQGLETGGGAIPFAQLDGSKHTYLYF